MVGPVTLDRLSSYDGSILMDWASVYQELRGWQALIGSLLGFGGLVIGALFNAHLNRKRDDRLRDTEAVTIALSLYGEIRLLRETAAELARVLGAWFINRGVHGHELPDHYREIYQLREPTLYNALAAKLGTLNPDILLPITKFYSDYETVTGHYPKLFHNEGQRVRYGPEWVLAPAIRAVEDIEEGLRHMERLGRIKIPARTPSVGRAQEALELDEALRPDIV